MLCDTTGDFVMFAIKCDVFDGGFTVDVGLVGFDVIVVDDVLAADVLADDVGAGVMAVPFWAVMVVIEVTVSFVTKISAIFNVSIFYTLDFSAFLGTLAFMTVLIFFVTLPIFSIFVMFIVAFDVDTPV